jgi:tRNA threonylcarbamoyladenosine biosynthesis protein TsaB
VLILAFDTTNEYGGAGLYEDAQCLGEIANPARAGRSARGSYSVTLFELVGKLLETNHVSLADVELFAAANGPGSFTGIRVGVAAAQGWAVALGRPVLGVSNLEAMVEAGRPETAFAAALLDARRGEFFLAIYQKVEAPASSRFKLVGEPTALRPEGVPAHLQGAVGKSAPLTCVVREYDRAAESLRSSLPDKFEWRTVSGTLVSAIARLALAASRRGELQSPAELDACYIRSSDAELSVG